MSKEERHFGAFWMPKACAFAPIKACHVSLSYLKIKNNKIWVFGRT